MIHLRQVLLASSWGLVVILLTLWLIGCAARVEYQPVPTWLIPLQPTVPTLAAEQLQCLSDEAYKKLVERDRACWQYARELRALVESSP